LEYPHQQPRNVMKYGGQIASAPDAQLSPVEKAMLKGLEI
jgi:hypothetical protein